MTIDDIKRYRGNEKRVCSLPKLGVHYSLKKAVVTGELSDEMKERLGIYQYISSNRNISAVTQSC